MSSACEGCPAVKPEELEEGLWDWDFVVALAGNPNTGKSTVFNTLTGLRQHTGNWPGKTVTRAEGEYEHGGMRFKLVDLPGTYSLLSASTDEEIARNFILFGGPDVTVVVVDATRLERNLNLVLQILEITDRAVICLNLMDEARRNGLEIDVERLESELGVPVVATAARYGEGMQELKDQIERVASGEISCHPRRLNSLPEGLKLALSELEAQTRRAYPHLPNPRWIALRLLDGDERINRAIERREFERRVEVAA